MSFRVERGISKLEEILRIRSERHVSSDTTVCSRIFRIIPSREDTPLPQRRFACSDTLSIVDRAGPMAWLALFIGRRLATIPQNSVQLHGIQIIAVPV